jgi:hypothetical protein
MLIISEHHRDNIDSYSVLFWLPLIGLIVSADDARRYKSLITRGLAVPLSCLSACYLVAIINSEEEKKNLKSNLGFDVVMK